MGVVTVAQQGAAAPKSISSNCQRKQFKLENCIGAQEISLNCVSFYLEISIHLQATYQISNIFESCKFLS